MTRPGMPGTSSHVRVPSIAEYEAHDGLHYRVLWVRVGADWTCPGCGRSRYQIMRWTKRFPGTPAAFMGWVAPLHTHHDHARDYEGGIERFRPTVVCDQCNAADGRAKRQLKLPPDFSFAPEELARFVTGTPHSKHAINLELAREIYNQVCARL